MADHPRVFLTLTAPSFGPVHTRPSPAADRCIPCRCGDRHHPDDPRLGTAVDPDTYDYTGAVLWQAHAGQLWARFTIALRRALAIAPRRPGPRFPDHARLSYAKVAEYQRRGLVHFHAVIRLDGPDGPTDPPPAALTLDALRDAITSAARAAMLTTTRPDGTPLVVAWGAQLDLRPVTSTATAQLEDREAVHRRRPRRLHRQARHQIHRRHRQRRGTDRPIRDGEHIDYRDVSPHHRRMIAGKRQRENRGGFESESDAWTAAMASNSVARHSFCT